MHRTALRVVAAILAACIPLAAAAQQWPAKPIRAIVPFGAGSTIDIIGRIVLEPLAAIAPAWRDPVSGLTVAELLGKLGRAG